MDSDDDVVIIAAPGSGSDAVTNAAAASTEVEVVAEAEEGGGAWWSRRMDELPAADELNNVERSFPQATAPPDLVTELVRGVRAGQRRCVRTVSAASLSILQPHSSPAADRAAERVTDSQRPAQPPASMWPAPEGVACLALLLRPRAHISASSQ